MKRTKNRVIMGDSDQYKNEDIDPPAEAKPPKKRADRGAQAKAFYRAMYAGAEPDPEDFGMQAPPDTPPAGGAPQPSGGGDGGSRGPCPMCAYTQSELDEAKKKAQEAENLYKRMAADFENYRKRVTREREEFSAAGVQRAVEAILPALDDMDMAKSKLSPTMDPNSMMESLNMVYNRFNRCLEQIGIKQLAVIGTLFDPKYHEPVQQVYTNDIPEGHIVDQLRPGYMFNDRVLRPSLVNVATGYGGDESAEPMQETQEYAQEAESQEYAQEHTAEEGAAEETVAGEYQENQEYSQEGQEYSQEQEHAQEEAEESAQQEANQEEHEQKGLTPSATQDLPVVDVASELLIKEFDEEEQASASEAKREN